MDLNGYWHIIIIMGLVSRQILQITQLGNSPCSWHLILTCDPAEIPAIFVRPAHAAPAVVLGEVILGDMQVI